MAISVMLMLNYAGVKALKRFTVGMRYEALSGFICSKWSGLSADNLYLTYNLPMFGDCILGDDEDVLSMFAMVQQLTLQNIVVNVKEKEKRAELGNRGRSLAYVDNDFQVQNALVGSLSAYAPSALLVENDGLCEERIMGVPSNGKQLLSHNWLFLIRDVGQVFKGGVVEFRKALCKFSVESGFEFDYVKNESYRVTAQCKYRDSKKCMWRIHASIEKCNKFCYIRKYHKYHTCGMTFGTCSRRRITSDIIAELIVDDIRAMPTTTPKDVIHQAKDKYGIDISYFVAWRAVDAGREVVYGDQTTSYSFLPSYFQEMRKTNPGSIFHLDVDEFSNNFVRCFFTFAGCLSGFKSCRPVVCVDGTFLKGKHKGILLSAVAKDGNDGLFPFAFAIVNEETNANWAWFLEHLRDSVGTERVLTFISDRCHGIVEGVKNIFPGSRHAFCVIHLKRNLKNHFRGVGANLRKAIVLQFDSCVYAASKEEFEVAMGDLRSNGAERIFNFLADLPYENWAHSYFEAGRYGQSTSNAVESWNAQIRRYRHLPITNFIDAIRSLLMVQMCIRHEEGDTWTTAICPNLETIVDSFVNEGRPLTVKKASEFVYEVYSVPNAVVDVQARTCSCRWWQINGYPCVHAAAVLFLYRNDGYEHIDEYFHVSMFKSTYAMLIQPFGKVVVDNQQKLVGPPDYHTRRGRPRVKRIPSRGEHIARKMKCGRCNEYGHHNKKTCTKRIG
ncbi:PREDICTED: uncharacterized protein LOC105953518 [Erythranthe guttata]|uniref:uncharacterized protein LOC105953518 n=1 Tax=Erythranthe guttata TaxID=4155 RepID=UPI00064E10FD|nr:PREDICTED: uncharacterized protein LOC105953518 [Erythranthe guttata]|eukprot:XP_012832642.1 PREDICTED: uncharacterized protein LOC105953518 [Erythranthe guttata]